MEYHGYYYTLDERLVFVRADDNWLQQRHLRTGIIREEIHKSEGTTNQIVHIMSPTNYSAPRVEKEMRSTKNKTVIAARVATLWEYCKTLSF